MVGASGSDRAIFPIGLATIVYKETIIKQCLPNLVIPTLSYHLVRSPGTAIPNCRNYLTDILCAEGSQGGTSISGVHGDVPRIRVIFSRKISEKGLSIFHKNSRKDFNICRKLQIGSVILMTQMTNKKKTELTDYFHLVWTINPQFYEVF